MKVNGKKYTSIWIEEDNRVFIIDQRWLPHEFKIVELTTINDFAISIKDMWVRGAPLIGVTAAFGFAKSMQHDNSDNSLEEIKDDFKYKFTTKIEKKNLSDFKVNNTDFCHLRKQAK